MAHEFTSKKVEATQHKSMKSRLSKLKKGALPAIGVALALAGFALGRSTKKETRADMTADTMVAGMNQFQQVLDGFDANEITIKKGLTEVLCIEKKGDETHTKIVENDGSICDIIEKGDVSVFFQYNPKGELEQMNFNNGKEDIHVLFDGKGVSNDLVAAANGKTPKYLSSKEGKQLIDKFWRHVDNGNADISVGRNFMSVLQQGHNACRGREIRLPQMAPNFIPLGRDL
ncbi:MAG: hypothetical protein II942_04615 [Alphaproteobacteria bacterium]|nr:hypothetical protein [Alphaproteobacteria bacterium]